MVSFLFVNKKGINLEEITERLPVIIKSHGARLFVKIYDKNTQYVIMNDAPKLHHIIQKPYRAFIYIHKNPAHSSYGLPDLLNAYSAEFNLLTRPCEGK